MPRICYVPKTFTPAHQAIIAQADRFCRDYAMQGLDLTLRQLYYRFVAADLIPNTQQSYKRLGSIINDARLAGELDWYHVIDRTRGLRGLGHWDSPDEIISSSAAGYMTDRWALQPYRVEVWVEKDALSGVIGRTAQRYDVDYFSCRGYTSQSELWRAARRMIDHQEDGKKCVVIHLGDHDPSGVDMTRDIEERFGLFGATVDVRRIALNMDQVRRYNPPPNPAKLTDSRATGYIREHGRSSWELDALDPTTLDALISAEIEQFRDEGLWESATAAMERDKTLLRAVSDRWAEVVDLVEGGA
ncbi:hypothetical protein HII36_43015 [Nonomuraea sp. NN258]|uniref:hypothetical protein n=1 Tax=Nonomuraea antri TaxID=2730852 RepID=UPI00156A1ACF|nr:hypothetical protein [Nonomuraea antri]NRQ38550.1 hypothetical protein [Nonomuraea antri]